MIFLFKDIVELNLIENRADAKKLLKLLAYQTGNLINYSQISNRLSIDVRTVQRYIEIFEQSFIVFRLYPYSKDKKIELIKSPKIYFYDVGIRNAIIGNYDSVDIRTDRGAIFENFIISEVLKINQYSDENYDLSYWRTKSGSEVDLVLHKHDEVIGCKIKVSKGTISKAFGNRYPNAKQRVINLDNFY